MPVEARGERQFAVTGTYDEEISRGHVRGAYPFTSYGRITTAAADRVLVRDANNDTLQVPQGVQMSVASSSADDSAAGTGIRTVVIEYLDGDLDLQVEVLTLNGSTPVLTQATDIRWIEAVHGATFGSLTVSQGIIEITEGAYVHAQISAGERGSHSSVRRVPRGKTLYIKSIYGGSSSGTAQASTLLELFTTRIDGIDQSETGLFYDHAGIILQDNSQTMALDIPFPVLSGDIVGFIASPDKAATVTAGFIGWVE